MELHDKAWGERMAHASEPNLAAKGWSAQESFAGRSLLSYSGRIETSGELNRIDFSWSLPKFIKAEACDRAKRLISCRDILPHRLRVLLQRDLIVSAIPAIAVH